jgi:hypothetical protein
MPDGISKGCFISMVRIDLLVMLEMTADLFAMTTRTHVMTMGLNTTVSIRACIECMDKLRYTIF